MSLKDIFDRSTHSDTEQQTVLLSVNFAIAYDCCMAAHTMLVNMKRVPTGIVEALRTGTPLPEGKLDSLATLTRSIVATRGGPDDAATEAFLKAGYENREYLEVIVGVTMKALDDPTTPPNTAPRESIELHCGLSSPLTKSALDTSGLV